MLEPELEGRLRNHLAIKEQRDHARGGWRISPDRLKNERDSHGLPIDLTSLGAPQEDDQSGWAYRWRTDLRAVRGYFQLIGPFYRSR